MIQGLLVLLGFIIASDAFALDPKKCFAVQASYGMLRKYEFPGYSSSEYMTKKHGTFGGSTEQSSQQSTGMIDPGFTTTGNIVSTLQFTSSDGGCSYFSKLKQKKRDYLARNRDGFLMDGSFGRGRHLRTVYHLSHCKDGGMMQFSKAVQANYSELSATENDEALINKIDSIISQDSTLQGLCQLNVG